MSEVVHPDNLLVKRALGDMSNMSLEEMHALEAHVASCGECQLARGLVSDLDLVGGEQAGDAERLQRMTNQIFNKLNIENSSDIKPRTEGIARETGWKRLFGGLSPKFRVAFALAAVLGVSLALAWIWRATHKANAGNNLRNPARPISQFANNAEFEKANSPGTLKEPLLPNSNGSNNVVDGASSSTREINGDSPVTGTAASANEDSSKMPFSNSRTLAAAMQTGVAPPNSTVQNETPSELFARANHSRRKGEHAEAISLYRELQHRFPDSPEATLSHVSLGRLLLSNDGNAGDALRELNVYLKNPANQSIREEAMIGRAQALQKLGRTEDELSAWRELLAQYPQSIYADQAHTRIHELQ